MWSSCDQQVQVYKNCDNLCQACGKKNKIIWPTLSPRKITSSLMGMTRRSFVWVTKDKGDWCKRRMGEDTYQWSSNWSKKCRWCNEDGIMMNNLTYHQFVMSCMGKIFYYIQAAQDSDENGDTRKPWKELCHQYVDMLENDLIALMTEFKLARWRMQALTLLCGMHAKLEHIHQRMKG